jgi:hypothetical protein
MNVLVTSQYLRQTGGSGGVTSWNDLEDKPFYHNSFSEVVIDNLTKEDYENNNKPSCTFIPGDLYTVIWNGIYYENVKCYTSDGYNTIQDPDVFLIDDCGGNGLFIIAGDRTVGYTVSVIHHVNDLQQLDEKYIPDTIARKDDLEHVTYWNDLEDKPFYDTGIEFITWDGDTTDKELNRLNQRIPMYKISDEFIPPELMMGATVTLVNRTDETQDVGEIVKIRYDITSFQDEQSYVAVSSFGSPTGADILVVHSDEYNRSYDWTRGVYVSEQINYGGWYVSEIKFNSTIKPLDEKYLPSTIPNIEEVQQMIDEAGNTAGGGSQADWNETSTSSLSYIKNKPFGLFLGEKIQTTCDITVPAEDLSESALGVYRTPDYKYPGEFWVGDYTYEVIIDGVPYYTQAIDGYSSFDYLGSFNLPSNPDEAEFPFLIYRDGNGYILIYFASPGPHTVKITAYAGGYELVKIDEKFIPDTIARKDDLKIETVSDDQIIFWLSEENVISPIASASGEMYTSNNNEIYVL